MNETTHARSLLVRPAVYQIRVHGRLAPRWSARLGGMPIAIREAPGQPTITEFTGLLPDQTALLRVECLSECDGAIGPAVCLR